MTNERRKAQRLHELVDDIIAQPPAYDFVCGGARTLFRDGDMSDDEFAALQAICDATHLRPSWHDKERIRSILCE